MILEYAAYSLLSFAIGLYVGAFFQRRGDLKAFKIKKKLVSVREN